MNRTQAAVIVGGAWRGSKYPAATFHEALVVLELTMSEFEYYRLSAKQVTKSRSPFEILVPMNGMR